MAKANGASHAEAEDGVQMDSWVRDTPWFVVKGCTGSGKTYFVEHLKAQIEASGSTVVYVPQYPMFKPQLTVRCFINMMPVKREVKQDLIANLQLMQVPTESGFIGGKMMGMMDLPGLSGGQRKKMMLAVSVATAINFQCPFVIMDEPFAGIDEPSMEAVLQVMAQASEVVPNLKFIVVTHDHFELLPAAASLLRVKDRLVTSSNSFSSSNGVAAQQFASTLLKVANSKAARRPFFDFYIVSRHFREHEYALPLVAYIVFAFLLGEAAVNFPGSLPGGFGEQVFVFLKMFMLEYPHFGSIVNYCFKRGQHMEDFYLNITHRKYPIAETIVIAFLQQAVLLSVATLVMSRVSDFWWINWKVVFVDFLYTSHTTIAYYMLPMITPNPILAMILLFPYVCIWCFLSGVLLPTAWFADGVKWLPFLSPVFHVGCAYTHVTDKIELLGTECWSSLPAHLALVSPFFILVLVGTIAVHCMDVHSGRKLRRALASAEG